MKGKEKEEKENIKLRFAVALDHALADSDLKSLRKLASAAGLEPAHVQRLAAGKVDASLSTIISLSEGLQLTYAEFANYYDAVTAKDISNFLDQKSLNKK